MQTLRSRVAQTRGTCHCPQCVQAVHGVGRRATASATQRMPKYLTSSTLFYSGVFAAAATWDAGAKKQRREQWDRAIADVKQELGQAAEAVGGSLRKESMTREAAAEATVSYTPDIFQDVEPHKQRSRWPTNTGPDLIVHRLPPESIYATGERRARAELSRWTPKKLETVMLSVDAMQLQIFLEMQRKLNPELRQAASAAVPVDYRDKMFLSVPELHASLQHKLEDLERIQEADATLSEWARSPDDVRLTSYHQDDQGTFHDTVRQLNESLQDLFRESKHEVGSVPSLVAKIAYNLSISSAPPNTNTYNTLLIGLSEVKQHRVVQRIIRSLRETHVRPNEITNAAVLSHMTATDNAEGFVHWIELMRGKHRGLALARPDIHINEAGKSRLLRVTREGKEDRVIQLPYPTPNVFGPIIKGVLKFSGFETALSIVQGMGHEGWGLCLSGLTPLLVHCADSGEWTNGLVIWSQIQALKSRSLQRYVRQKEAVEKVPLEAFAAMARLCSKAGQKGTFQEIWAQAMRAHVQSAGALVHLVKSQNETATKTLVARAAELSADHQRKPGRIESLDAAENTSFEIQASIEPSLARETKADMGNVLHDPVPVEETKAAMPKRIAEKQPPASSRGMSERPTVLLREQLDGLLPAGHELEHYELGERPMTMYT